MLIVAAHRRKAGAARWAAAAVLLAAQLGCAGGGGGGGATATAPPTGAVSGLVTAAPAGGAAAGIQPVPGALLCDVLTAQAIRAATGIDVVSSVAQDGTAATECDYRAGDGSSVLVLQDRSQQLVALGSTGTQVAAALRADSGATVLSIGGAQTALLNHATGVPGVFLLARGHWFYLSLPAAAVSDPTGAVTTLAAQAVPVLSTEAQ